MANTYIEKILGQNEHILLVVRQHWFKLFSAILLEIIIALVIAAATTLAIIFGGFIWAPFGFILLIFPAFSMVHNILQWSNRQYIVTNHRVIQASGIFNKNIVDSSLEKVNDVKLAQSMWGRMFNFGDVEILTASELGANLFRYIGDPILYKTTMINAKMQLSDEDIRSGGQKSIPDLIEDLDGLRQKHVITEEEFQQKKKDLLSKI
jgi:membrane protein YdbS with pleckstrin-like domain